MKISIISLYYDKNIKSGSNIRFEETIRILLKMKVLNKIIVVNDQKPDFVRDINTIFIKKLNLKNHFINRIYLYFKLCFVIKNLEKNIIINDFFPVPVYLLKKHYYYQLIHDLRDWNNIRNSYFIKFIRYFQLNQWKKSYKIITVSNFTKNQLIERTKKNPKDIIVSYNGVREISNNIKAYKERKIDILCVSPFESRKNHITLIKAINLLHKNKIKINCIFIGKDRGLLKEIKNLVDLYDLHQLIEIKTNIDSQDQLLSFYNNSKILCFPSIYEGFGIPIIEAFASGTKVVCSNIKPFKEICKNFAKYHDPFDYDCLSNIIQDELKKKPNFLKLQNHVSRNFIWKDNISKMVNSFIR